MPLTTLSSRMLCAAQQLAGQIEGGAFDALTPDGRCDLRQLSLTIAGWADLVETAEGYVQIAAASPVRS